MTTRTLRRTIALGRTLAMVAGGSLTPGPVATAAAQAPIAASPPAHYDFSAPPRPSRRSTVATTRTVGQFGSDPVGYLGRSSYPDQYYKGASATWLCTPTR